MNQSEVKIGVRVVYARGAKGPLIGKCGTIDSEWEPYEYGIVMVKFDDGNSYPCFYKNLDVIKSL